MLELCDPCLFNSQVVARRKLFIFVKSQKLKMKFWVKVCKVKIDWFWFVETGKYTEKIENIYEVTLKYCVVQNILPKNIIDDPIFFIH